MNPFEYVTAIFFEFLSMSSVNPVYPPIPCDGEGNQTVTYVDKEDVCSFCLEPVVDGKTYFKLPCEHYICRICLKHCTRRLENGGSLRCHCGVSYPRATYSVALYKPTRVLIRGHTIVLDSNIKEEIN